MRVDIRRPEFHVGVATLGGLAAAVLAWFEHPAAAATSVILGVGVGAVFVDVTERRIPTRLVWIGLAGLVAAAALDLVQRTETERILAGGLSATVVGAVFVVIHLWRPEAMGFGDVRLATLSAGAIGWGTGHVTASFAAMLAASFGATIALVLLRKRTVPFAPFLIPAAVAATLLG